MALPFDVIDTHVHLYPDKIAEKVTGALGLKFGNPPAFVATVASCEAFSAKSGIPLSINLPVATAPDQVEQINRWAREIRGPRVLSLAPFHSSPREVAELSRRFPKLKIAAAHLGGFRMWGETERELCGADVYLDLSHALLWMPDEQLLRIVREHGVERILFGSDAPWQDPRDVLAAFLKLPFTDEERTMILAQNARRLFRVGGES